MDVGLMGLGGGGSQIAELLMKSSWCRLVAVGARKGRRTEAFSAQYPEIAAYDDLRSMIVETSLDAIFVAVPSYLRARYLPLAAQQGVPVWMLPPAGRGYGEALNLVREFERQDCPIVVYREWGIDPVLAMDNLGLERMAKFFFARAHVMHCWGEDLDWRGDSKRAGGGVLLHRAYPLVDNLIQVMGMPATVHAVIGSVSRPGGRYPYDTEDTSTVIMQYTHGAMATISACWTAGPVSYQMVLNGLDHTLEMDRQGVKVWDRTGDKLLHETKRSGLLFESAIDQFFHDLASQTRQIKSTLQEHLATLAVIDAAYLSAKTGQPEHPDRIISMHQSSA